jgi:ATP-binding cassette, subfamily G (WHITE), eye pigment precursor transporter
MREESDASWCTQFWTIFKRNGINTFRQPMDFILKVIQAIFFGIIAIVLYYQKGNTFEEVFQNNQGVLFFLVMNTGFSYVFASVNLFNFERPVFIRERLSNTYTTSAYYIGRTVAVLPVEIFTLFLFLVIAYFPCNLDNSAGVFFLTLLSLELCAYMSSSFGLLLSTIFSDAGVVMSLVPVLIIPFLLVGGFFVPLETVFGIYYPFEYVSMFRYGFESLVYSQYENNPLIVNGVSYDLIGTRYNFQVHFNLFRPPSLWISS